MRTAVEDELTLKNPCILKKAGAERPAERPIATVAQVYEIADAILPRFRIVTSASSAPLIVIVCGSAAL